MRRKSGLGFLVVASIAVGSGMWGSVPAGAQGDIDEVTFTPTDPVPWEPFTVDVELGGCDADTPGAVTVSILQPYSELRVQEEIASADFTSDGLGDASVSVPVPVGYPGDWVVDLEGCDVSPDLRRFSFAIAAPDDFTMAAAGGFVRGLPFEVEVSGGGCGGSDWVSWYVVESIWRHGDEELPEREVPSLAYGSATPDGAGNWSGDGTGTVPVDHPDEVIVAAACVFRTAEGSVSVYYPHVVLPVTTARAPSPVDVEPRFTG